MNHSLRRLISAAVLVGWLMPSVGALGIGMHLASGHHGPHDDDHHREIANLVRATTHGHHHDLDAEADHQHDARLEGQSLVLRSGALLLAVLPLLPSVEAPRVGHTDSDWSRHRGPPLPLFTANCSLLL